MKWNESMRPVALIALIGGIIGSGAVNAAVVANPNTGDIFLGIRASGGTGSQTSYLINLGQDTLYRNAAPGSSFTVGIGNAAADLSGTYGSGWSSRTDLSWGVFGVRTSASSSVYASQERLDPTVPTTPWAALDLNGRNSTGSQISSVIDGTNGYRGRDASVNSALAVFQPNSSNASSYSFQVSTPGTTDFGSLSQWGNIEGTVGNPSGSVLDFYRLSGSLTDPVQLLGSFTLSSTGTLTFTAASAVPESSSAILGAAGVGLLLTSRRRKTISL